MTDGGRAAWDALLDRFERELDATDLDADSPAGADPAGEWTPPAEPLPAELAERAQRVLERQRERMHQTRRELDDVREQLSALRRVPSARTDAPAYLDIDG
jgi:hypothetical protein